MNKATSRIHLVAYDVSEHFQKNWQGTGFKAQLTAPDKATALKFKEAFDEFGQVRTEVLISGPDTREGNETIYTVGKEAVQAFWKEMMAKYGTEKEYNKQLINAFKHGPEPEIIIVVDKLLTGFDAPRNTVLYICRSLKEHTLLQAIARVNRLFEGKDFGYIVDYYGVLQELDEALGLYSSLPEFEPEDLAGTLTDVSEEVERLPQRHSELWDVFKTIKSKLDEEEYELLLADEEVFYRKFSKILQEAIDAYHQRRIDELEYLKRVTEVMNSVLNRTGDELPAILRERDVAKAFFGVVNEVFQRLETSEAGEKDFAAEIAVGIDDIVQRSIVVDWDRNIDVQNRIRNDIDDLLYALKADRQVSLTTADMDSIVERSLDIAKARYGK